MGPRPDISLLMIVDDFPPLFCGIGDYAARLVTLLQLGGHVDVTVLTKHVDGLAEREDHDGVRILRVVRGWMMSDLTIVLKVLDQLEPTTIVHIQYSSASGYYRRCMINLLPAFLRILRPQVTVIVTLHGFHDQRWQWRARAAPMLIASNARIFVHHTDHAMVTQWLRPPRFKSAFIPQAPGIAAVDITDSERSARRKSLGLSSTTSLIVFFGGIRPDKGVDDLIRAVQSIRSRFPVHLLVLTAQELKPRFAAEYKTEVAGMLSCAIEEKWASLVPAPSSNEVPRLLRTADLAVFPFRMGASENRSSLLAALVNRVPVLTTRGVSTPDGFEQEYGVETVPTGDQAALTSAIGELLRCPAALHRLQERATNASRRFSWDAVASSTVAVYRSVLAENSAS